jgi:spermidine synthase
VLILIGFTAAIAQIVLLRELMAVFYGNEISLGLMLASWLLWTAAGSSLAGRITLRMPGPRRLMAALEVLLAAVLPCTILAVREAKGLLETVPGEVLGPGPILLTSLAVLAPLCLLSGSLFTAGSRVYAAAADLPAAEAAGSVYLWEAVGSSLGGLLAGLVLVRFLGPLEIAAWLAVLNLVAACGLAIAARRLRQAAIGALAFLALLLQRSGAPPGWEQLSQSRFWRGRQLIATRNSVYGNLAVVGTEGSRSVYENGVVLFNVPDPAAAEEAVHYALLEHPSPQSLLLIGGGINGSIAEALRHPSLERLDYVELDRTILELAREYFPDQWHILQADPRVHIHVTDGRLFLKTTRSAFDVVIVNLPDPQNAQLNRFYTAEFFREVSRRLTPTGLLAVQLRSSETHIGPDLGQFLRSIHRTLEVVFPEVAAIPGETVHFFAAGRPGVLASGAAELLARLHARHIQTNYVSPYFVPFRMAPDRMADLDLWIQPGPEAASATPVNRDFLPVAYYFDVALWSGQFHAGYRHMFRALAAIPFGFLLAVFGMLLAASLAAMRFVPPGRARRLVAGCCTAATGFTMIGLEMLLLLAFQAVYGYVYQQLAILIAAFMAGMSLGTWLAGRATAGMRLLAATQVLAAAAPLVLAGLFQAIGNASAAYALAASRLAFPAMAVVSGMLGGFEFPVANRIFKADHPGTLYAMDLAGSCLGAILFSAWLVPVFGFLRTAMISAAVSLVPAAMAMLPGSTPDPVE